MVSIFWSFNLGEKRSRVKLIRKRTLIAIILFILGLIIVHISLLLNRDNYTIHPEFQQPQFEGEAATPSEPLQSVQFEDHESIGIRSNKDFATQGWPGNGSQGNPYLISGLRISEIYICDVDVYFQIVHCNLTGGIKGIEFLNVSNGQIINNTISDYSKPGVYMMFSSGNLISNNIISNNQEGITLEAYCNNTIIANNTITNNIRYGIAMEGFSCTNTIYNNFIIRNSDYGISLQSVSNNTISYNTIRNSGIGGLLLFFAYNNSIMYNNFIGNVLSPGYSQARCYNESNIFSHNYWDDWTIPDENNDGVVDDPYPISAWGTTEDLYFEDPFPVTSPHYITIHFLSVPKIKFPTGGEVLSGTVSIKWAAATDSHGHSINYTLFYCPNGGPVCDSWVILTSGLSTTSYDWDTTLLNDGTVYMIMVNASCSEGSWQIALSDRTFAIDNLDPTPTSELSTNSTSSPSIISSFSIIPLLIVLTFSVLLLRRRFLS